MFKWIRSRGIVLATLLALTVVTRSHSAEIHWIRLHSANFELYTSAGPRSARDTLKQFERVRSFFLQALGGPVAKPSPVRLIAFNSAKEYEPYRPNAYAIAYYHQTPDRDYIVMSHGGADTFPLAVHEYVHLLVRHSDMNVPLWLDEGMAELYSTLKPIGDKVLVGGLIPGRHQALLQGKWVPLETILAADHKSPYYNEKDQAGSLYNEGWALTHMFFFRAEYRPKFSELMRTISNGAGSSEAIAKIYGRTVAQVDKDLQAYLRGTSFQGALVPAKFEKNSDEIPFEALSDFDTNLMFADLNNRPGKEQAVRTTLEQLLKQDPQRPEAYRGLGYLAWRERKHDEAVQYFGKAYEHGDRDPRLLWDYGRLAEAKDSKEAIRVLFELLTKDPDRMEVRLELAETQLRSDQAQAALQTLQPIRKVTPADAPRFFKVAAYAHMRNGDQKSAHETAERFKALAKTDEQRTEAEQLVSQTSGRQAALPKLSYDIPDGSAPRQRRGDSDSARAKIEREEPPPPPPPSASGRFVELDCRGTQARMVIETAAGRQIFAIEDPNKIVIKAGAGGTVDLACGPQEATGQRPPGICAGVRAGGARRN